MLNRAMLIGRLGREPELHMLQSGPVCNLSVATSEYFNDKSGKPQERVEWHRVVVFGKPAEACGNYLKKGRLVFVEGRLRTREYEADGSKRYSTEIVASRVQFLGAADKGEPQPTEMAGDEGNGEGN